MYVTLKDKSVLIIEDDECCLDSTSRLLQNFVMHLYYASDTDSAMRILESTPIDCIVCDILLGKEDGLNFIQTVRDFDSNIPIIVISGHVNEDCLMRAIPLNLVAYLTKPLKHTDFMDALSLCSKRMKQPANNLIYVKNHYYYDVALKVLKKEDQIYKLHDKEIFFIEMAIKHKNNIITKQMFYEFVWQFQEMSDSALKNFILRIRRRFGKDFIEAVNKIGYRFSFFICVSIAGKYYNEALFAMI